MTRQADEAVAVVFGLLLLIPGLTDDHQACTAGAGGGRRRRWPVTGDGMELIRRLHRLNEGAGVSGWGYPTLRPADRRALDRQLASGVLDPALEQRARDWAARTLRPPRASSVPFW